MRMSLEHSETQYKELVEQLTATKKSYDSQIAEVKLVCDQRIATLDRRLAEKEQVSVVIINCEFIYNRLFIPIGISRYFLSG